MSKELIERLITSFFLLFILGFSYINKYCLALTLVAVSIISFIEFKNLIDKLFNNIVTNRPFFKIILLLILSIYLVIFSLILWQFFNDLNLKYSGKNKNGEYGRGK